MNWTRWLFLFQFLHYRSQIVEFGRSLLLERLHTFSRMLLVVWTILTAIAPVVTMPMEENEFCEVHFPEVVIYIVMATFICISVTLLAIFVIPLLNTKNPAYRRKAKENILLSSLVLLSTVTILSFNVTITGLSVPLFYLDVVLNTTVMLTMTRKGWKPIESDEISGDPNGIAEILHD